MSPSLGALLVGPADRPFRRVLNAMLAVALFALLFVAASDGYVASPADRPFLRGELPVVAGLAAVWVGFGRGGVAFAWLAATAAMLGGTAGHALVQGGQPRLDRLARFLDAGAPPAVAEGLLLGTLGFLGGALVARVLGRIRGPTRTRPQ